MAESSSFDPVTGYCEDLCQTAGLETGCCESCHEDIDYGFELLERAFEGRDYQICCWVDEAFERRYPEVSDH